jgi:mycoredoxin
MPEYNSLILVYGTNWCPDCIRVRKFLDTRNIDYRWFNIDKDPDACSFVEMTNHGFQSVPTIVWPDGSILVEPSLKQLISKLDL